MENTELGNQKDILNPREVAELLDVHEKTVRNMLMKGELPGKQFGRQWRCLRSAIYEMIPKGVPSQA